MSTQTVIVKSITCATLVMGTGFLLMKYTLPKEEEFVEKLSDDLKVQFNIQLSEQQRQSKNLREMMLANARSDLPIWDVRGLDQLPKSTSN